MECDIEVGLDFNKIVKHHQLKSTRLNSGCLITLPAPTGSGKTFGMVEYITNEILRDKKFRSFVVTTQIRTIPENEFFEKITKSYETKHGPFRSDIERDHFFYQKVAVLRSLPDTINCLINAKLPEIQNAGMTRELQHQFDVLKAEYQRYRRMGDRDSYESLKVPYWQFKQVLLRCLMQALKLESPLNDEGKSDIERYIEKGRTELARFLNQYFPEINLRRHQLVLLTWSKFISSHQSFYDRGVIRISSTQCLGHALVVLDEIDAMKPILTAKIIDDAFKTIIDFLPVFSEISRGVNQTQKNRSEYIMSVLRQEQRFSQLKRQVNYLADKYKLEQDYKTIGKMKTNFIFNLDQLTLTSRDKYWSQPDKPGKKVDLINKPPKKTDLHFYEMLKQMNRFLNQFIRTMTIWAEDYREKVNQHRGSLDNQLTIENALLTISDSLGLSNETRQLIIKLYQQHGNLKQVKTDLFPLNDQKSGRYLQRHGLQLVALTDSEAHLNRTAINAVSIRETPEKFLLRLANRGVVLGMSATVDINTVISNFDFNFLREQLGDRLINGLAALSVKQQDELNVGKRCIQAGVKVNLIDVRPQSGLVQIEHVITQLLEKRLVNLSDDPDKKAKLTSLDDRVQRLMLDVQEYCEKLEQNSNDKRHKFIQRRYIELFDSFICFLANIDMPTCLGLQTILPKMATETAKIEMSFDDVQFVFDQLALILCSPQEKVPQLKMIAKKLSSSSVDQQIQDALRLPETEQTRVYLLSAYRTLGVSQNLQHKIGKLETGKVINVAPASTSVLDKRHLMVDLAGIYLGQITHNFTQIPKVVSMDNVKEWTLGYLELMELVDSGEISLLEAKKYAMKQSMGIPAKQFRHTPSNVGTHTSVVLQALGRLDRSFNRLPELTVMLGTDVLDYFNVSKKSDYQLGPLAQAMRQTQQAKKMIVMTDQSIQRERWVNRTLETQNAVAKMVTKLRTSQRNADRYQYFREVLLKYPTMTFKQYHKSELYPEFAYLDRQDTTYKVQRNKESFSFSADDRGNETVAEITAGLPTILKYPGMSDYFKINNWATAWEKQEFIMNPVQFDNYLGILGEVAGKYILEKEWPVKLKKLTLKNNEWFDFKIGDDVFVDFKLWHYPHQSLAAAERRHVMEKLAQIETNQSKKLRVVIINVLQPATVPPFVPKTIVNNQIMEVPYLLDQDGKFALTANQKKTVGEFLFGK